MTYAEPDIRNAPITLWRIARAFIVVLHDLFGDPRDIARHGMLLIKEHAPLNGWLRIAEALMRHLLLIEALHVPVPPASSRQSQTAGWKPAVRKQRLFEFDPEKPEDWRVSFRSFSKEGARDLRSRNAGAGAHAPPEASRSDLSAGLRDAWPIALRYQALLRVFNDPYAFAKRLARRLRANPKRTSELRRTPPKFFDRVDDTESITNAAAEAEKKLCDTS